MNNLTLTCIYCGQDENATPLLSFQYQGQRYLICPQHFPILIHQPARLADKLPGLASLTPAEGHG